MTEDIDNYDQAMLADVANEISHMAIDVINASAKLNKEKLQCANVHPCILHQAVLAGIFCQMMGSISLNSGYSVQYCFDAFIRSLEGTVDIIEAQNEKFRRKDEITEH